MFGTLFNDEVQVKPAIVLSFFVIERLYLGSVGYWDPVVEKDNPFSGKKPLPVVLKLCVDFELHDFRKLSDRQVIRNVESEEKATD